jgi:hypothetical protein
MKLRMQAPHLGCLLLLSASGALQACDSQRESTRTPPAAVSVAGPDATNLPEEAEPPPLPNATPLAEQPACRAVRVIGKAMHGDVALVSGTLLDGNAWVTLEAGASVALKHSTSARELAVKGPALFRACRKGREQLLLTRGNVLTTAGAGARPGAEVLIATPIAILRYGDAELSLSLDAKKLSVEMRSGQAELEPADASKPVKSPLVAKDKRTLLLGKPNPEQLVLQCKRAAEAAEVSARRVGDRSASEQLGERAQAHVRARKAARAACTIAAASAGLVADADASAGLWAEVLRWEGLWETIPRQGPAPAPEK